MLAMIYQGEIVYIIKCQLVLSWNGSKGGSQGSEDPTKASERGLRPRPPCHNNLFTIGNCERFKCDGQVLERNDS